MQHGVNLLVRDCGGRSALHAAAQNGQTAVVSYILQRGERRSAQAFMSFSPIEIKGHHGRRGQRSNPAWKHLLFRGLVSQFGLLEDPTAILVISLFSTCMFVR